MSVVGLVSSLICLAPLNGGSKLETKNTTSLLDFARRAAAAAAAAAAAGLRLLRFRHLNMNFTSYTTSDSLFTYIPENQ